MAQLGNCIHTYFFEISLVRTSVTSITKNESDKIENITIAVGRTFNSEQKI